MSRDAEGCCGSGQSCDGLDRRQFIKTAGAGLVSISGAGGRLMGQVPGAAEPMPRIRHFVPADKRLSADWLAALTARGEREVFRGKDLNLIGMPVGGIAAGQVYLCGDGTLGCWQVFNQRYFTGYGRDNYRPRMPERPIDQGFAAVVEDGGRTVGRRLDRRGFRGVDFVGEYPMGFVRYDEPAFPIRTELAAFSPFVPLNAGDSALPATVLRFAVRNTSDRAVRVAILGRLGHAIGFHSIPTYRLEVLRRHRIVRQAGRGLAVHSVEIPPEGAQSNREHIVLADFEGDDYGDWTVEGEAFGKRPARGTLTSQKAVSGFAGGGLVNTFLGGDRPHGRLTSPEFVINRPYINFLIGGGDHAGETCVNLLIGGRAAATAAGHNDERLAWHAWDVRGMQNKKARVEIVDGHSGGWGHVNVDQIELSDRRRFGTAETIDRLEDFGSMALAHDGPSATEDEVRRWTEVVDGFGVDLHIGSDGAYPATEQRSSALATSMARLAPGQERIFTFVLSWHFPNRAERGQMYANRFDDAGAVAHHVFDNSGSLIDDTRAWHDAYYGGTLPRWLLNRLHSTVANLATGTCQWWKNGRFWAWEGVGCCSGTCTHVWNYAHGAARLFPELERSGREMQDLGAALHEDGLVGFRGRQNKAYAADGQCGTVLKCYREHQVSADDGFLRRNWANIKRVLEYSLARDADGDGVITDSQHNTYDINFHGANTFVGSLYLAALRAGEEMAKAVGDTAFAEQVRRLFDSGGRRTVERLWNGEFFVQDVDLDKHPKRQYGPGCLSDQLFGQGWAHQLGLGYLYPREHVRTALESIWKYNWAPDIGPQNARHKPERWFVSPGEAGLFTCTWPKSVHLEKGVRYRNEVWTGIEYQVAGHMIWEGMVTEGLAIVRAIHDRYHPSKHNPFNEVECGDHYARALASWGVYLALCGYEYDGPKGHLGFAPRLGPEDFRAAFTAAEGWGVFEQRRRGAKQTDRIELRRGRLRLRALALSIGRDGEAAPVAVRIGDRKIEAVVSRDGERLLIRPGAEIVLEAGDALDVTIG